MKVITKCPRCGKYFMYDPIWDYNLFRVETGEVNKIIVICKDCKEDEINQQEIKSVE